VLNRDKIIQIRKLGGSENFVGLCERDKSLQFMRSLLCNHCKNKGRVRKLGGFDNGTVQKSSGLLEYYLSETGRLK